MAFASGLSFHSSLNCPAPATIAASRVSAAAPHRILARERGFFFGRVDLRRRRDDEKAIRRTENRALCAVPRSSPVSEACKCQRRSTPRGPLSFESENSCKALRPNAIVARKDDASFPEMETRPTPPRLSARSKDGTEIGFQILEAQSGSSPYTLVLVQGSFGTAAHFEEFAQLLVKRGLRVVLPDRRGRGASPCAFAPEAYDAQREVEDLDAVLTATNASMVFGLSSGAIVALETALALPGRLSTVVLYEPPLLLDGLEHLAPKLAKFQDEMSSGRVAAGMVTAMRLGQFAPWWISGLPRPLLEALTWLALHVDSGSRYPPLRDLALSTRFDFALVFASSATGVERFKGIGETGTKIMLLGGSRSPAYLRKSLDALSRVLPSATKREIPNAGHGASWNADRGGSPGVVVPLVCEFLGAATG